MHTMMQFWRSVAGMYCAFIFVSAKEISHNPQLDHHLIYKRSSNDETLKYSCQLENEDWDPAHVPGECSTFHTKMCLCQLNGNCWYDISTNKCIEKTDCSLYNGFALACRARHCFYDCKTGECLSFSGEDTSCENSHGKCHKFCGDICLCHLMGCQFRLDGSCKEAKDIACPESAWWRRYCGRENAFYYHKGYICENIKRSGKCIVDRTVAAINMGNASYTDSNGITYDAEESHGFVDQYGIRKTKSLPTANFHGDDKYLYSTIVYADDSKREDGRCVSYNLFFCEDGIYELKIKTIEIFDILPVEKTFNILLGTQYVFMEVDVARLAGNTNVPVEIVVNFKVMNKILLVEGLPPTPIKNGTVALKFCFGECLFSQALFEVAAFSLLKLDDSRNSANDESHCKWFKGNHWPCVNSFCHYNQTSGVCSSVKGSHMSCTDEKCMDEYPGLEVLFFLDGTGSSQDLMIHNYSKVFDEFNRMRKIGHILSTAFPKKTKLGVALFSDFWCGISNTTNVCNFQHNDKNGCYRRTVALTEDIKTFNDGSDRTKLTVRYSQGREPAMFDLMLAVQDRGMGWTPGKHESVFKLVILITDDSLHLGTNNGVKEPKYDGTDTCHETKFPGLLPIGNYLQSEGISLFIITETNRQRIEYELSVGQLNIPRKYAFLDEDPTDIASTIAEWIRGF